jgi:acyl carrier protein
MIVPRPGASGTQFLSRDEQQPAGWKIVAHKSIFREHLLILFVKGPMSETIQDRVVKIIGKSRRIPPEDVRPESTFEELGIDSLDRLNILFDLESEFDIEIDDEEAKRVTNVGEMVAGITQLVEAKGTASPAS